MAPEMMSSSRSKATNRKGSDYSGSMDVEGDPYTQGIQNQSTENLDRISESSDSIDEGGSLLSDEDDEFICPTTTVAKTIETESKHHGNWRIVVISFLLLLGAGLAVMTFQALDTQKRSENQEQFEALVVASNNRAKDQTQSIMHSLERISDQFEREALLITSTDPANYVTLPRFEYTGRDVLDHGIQHVSYAPIIELRDDGLRWENYSIANDQWIDESVELADLKLSDTDITPYIWFEQDLDGTPIPAIIRPTPFVPVWQTSPITSVQYVINQDIYAFDYFPALLSELQQGSSPVISALENATAIWGDLENGQGNHAILSYPVHNKSAGATEQVMAALVTDLSWDAFMTGIMDTGAPFGVSYVLVSSCGQKIVYASGNSTGVLGNAALVNEIERSRLSGSFSLFDNSSNASSAQGGCKYSVEVFASYQAFNSSGGANLMPVVVFALFVAVAFFYVLYDKFLEGRIAQVAEKAARSNALVSSLFPSQVHDRLFDNDEGSEIHSKRSKQSGKRSVNIKSKYEIEHSEEDDSAEMFRTRPIADLFPVATLLFADIAGFTAWSSARQPTEVFTLLETLYRNFDMIARKRGIFKVETVGDCYVAASGIPDPRKDHCVAMCRFARDILVKTKELVRKLESTLGPDTNSLHMRIGIHSGPVTGGVLRGEKSRFQLFGDSMNTTSRIETTGMKGRIHISQETADLLVAAGKMNWFYPREEKVFAKGKGEMNTFWLKTRASSGGKVSRKRPDRLADIHFQDMSSCDVTENEADSDTDSDSDSDMDDSDSDMETETLLHDLVSPKTARLIEFNTEVLLRFLKLIKRQRQITAANRPVEQVEFRFPAPLCTQEAPLASQMKQVISMPAFDPVVSVVAVESERADEVSLDKAVIQELHDFVTNIAIMHKSQLAFHCFDHASHVMLSVTKFLSRLSAANYMPGRRNSHENIVDTARELHERTHGISSDSLAQFACVFSALIHDVDHPGVLNEHLVQENSELVEAYQGICVAEQNSFDLAWGLLTDEQYPNLRAAIFETPEEMERFRSLVMNCVLATDVIDDTLRDARNLRWTTLFSAGAISTSENTDHKATLILEYVVRASDVIHAMQHWHIYRQWSGRQFMELYRAYQQGRIKEDPSKDWYEKEIAFFDKCIIPTAGKLEQCEVFGVASREAYNYATQNRLEWIARGRDVVEEMVASCDKRRTERIPASIGSPMKTLNASATNLSSQADKVAALIQQVHMLELEEERIRNANAAPSSEPAGSGSSSLMEF